MIRKKNEWKPGLINIDDVPEEPVYLPFLHLTPEQWQGATELVEIEWRDRLPVQPGTLRGMRIPGGPGDVIIWNPYAEFCIELGCPPSIRRVDDGVSFGCRCPVPENPDEDRGPDFVVKTCRLGFDLAKGRQLRCISSHCDNCLLLGTRGRNTFEFTCECLD